MKQKFIMLSFFAFFFLIHNICNAQQDYSSLVCRNHAGVLVQSLMDSSISDIAIATQNLSGEPIIYYNPNITTWDIRLKLFVFAHECGHHALNHINSPRLNMEQEADCFAIVTLVKKKILTLEDIPLIQSMLDSFGPGDWMHLPGEIRSINLGYCLKHAGIDIKSPTLSDDKPSDNCQEIYSICVEEIGNIDDCLRDNYPQRCIDVCENHHGYDYLTCANVLCQPTPANLRGWRLNCQDDIREAKDECNEQRKTCLTE